MALMRMAIRHDADDSSSDLCPWAQDDTMFRQDILIPFNILIKFKATEYSYSVRNQNFEDIRFKGNSIFIPSLVCVDVCMCLCVCV